METGYAELTVYFEDPFWVGVYQRGGGGTCQVCRLVFGGEPRDGEVYALLLERWRQLRFSPAMEAEAPGARKINPKRMQRQITRQLRTPGVGTKAQQALKLQQEQGKAARKRRSKEEREAEKAKQFVLRREKQRERHKGH